jgi:class III poly(R)-hydroxyalkanoic acid synthase PhaC subunit
MMRVEEEFQSLILPKLSDFTKDMENAVQVYYEYYHNFSNFIVDYNLALMEAATNAAKSYVDTKMTSLTDLLNEMRAAFDSTLRNRLNEQIFASRLGAALDSWARVADLFGYYKFSRNFSDFISYSNRLVEPLRDTFCRTPSEVIEMKGRFNLLHYKSLPKQPQQQILKKTPLLVIYALINRHYILDLLPKFSIINDLLNQGFDIYATDWGTPSSYDKDLTIENYAEEYVGNAVEKIKEITGYDKVSLLGYCWGGIFSLIYSATYPENVKNLILHATPVDIEQGKTVIENWTSHINADRLVQAFGNVPGWLINAAFLMRNPVEAILKYPRFFSRPRSFDEILQFFAIEAWLYDSPPIIGKVYQQIVDQIYKQNLLIKNKMKVGNDVINLTNITMPVLDIVGSTDDLVPPQSSRSVINMVSCKDKRLIEFPIGHVGLCTSEQAHKNLWPEVGRWLAQRS